MIFDTLDKLERYRCIPHVREIADFISTTDVWGLDKTDIPIRGADLYVKVLEYDPKPASENHFETHQLYADVQVMVRGVEMMQTTNPKHLVPVAPYDEKRDLQFFAAERNVSDIVIGDNEFIVFFPGEVHKPGCLFTNQVTPVFKLVFKIKMA